MRLIGGTGAKFSKFGKLYIFLTYGFGMRFIGGTGAKFSKFGKLYILKIP